MTTPALAPLLDQLSALIADSERLTREWRARGLLLEDDLAVFAVVGEPDPTALEAFKDEFREHCDRPVPHALAATLARLNGVALFEGDPSEEGRPSVVPADELEDHERFALYPLATQHDRWLLDEADLFDEEGTPVAIGEILDSGWFVSVVPPEGETCAVYWVARDFSRVSPVKLATSLEGYLLLLIDAVLSLPGVLAAAKVPGWGG